MPVYDYHCLECGDVFTVTLALSEKEQKGVRCPACQSNRAKQLIAPFSVKTSNKT
ncbi:MAG TPA: zinc ribbon domain-containing protein [Nitrospiria bacterium]